MLFQTGAFLIITILVKMLISYNDLLIYKIQIVTNGDPFQFNDLKYSIIRIIGRSNDDGFIQMNDTVYDSIGFFFL